MHVIKINDKEAMNLKEGKEEYLGEFEESNGKWERPGTWVPTGRVSMLRLHNKAVDL